MRSEELLLEPKEAKGGIFKSFKINLSNYTPVLGLVGLIIFFAVTTKGKSIAVSNLQIIINQAVVLVIIATGSIFIYSMGLIDISIGMNVALTAAIGAQFYLAVKSPVLLLILCIVFSGVISSTNGFLVSLLKLPSFIVTLAMMNILSAFLRRVLGDAGNIFLSDALTPLDTVEVKVMLLVIFVVFCIFIFNYTKLGRANRIIGGNSIVAFQSGILIARNTIISFLITGMGAGLAAYLLLIRTGSVSSQTGASYGFDTMIAIVLGGMPISGGARSRITAALVGGITLTLLNNGLVLLGVSIGYLQIVRGALFVGVLVLSGLKTRSKILVR